MINMLIKKSLSLGMLITIVEDLTNTSLSQVYSRNIYWIANRTTVGGNLRNFHDESRFSPVRIISPLIVLLYGYTIYAVFLTFFLLFNILYNPRFKSLSRSHRSCYIHPHFISYLSLFLDIFLSRLFSYANDSLHKSPSTNCLL